MRPSPSSILPLLLPTVTLSLTLPNALIPSRFGLLQPRQSCAEYCGSHCYSDSAINAALNAGCNDLDNGNEPGGYPHQYNDYEGFSFPDGRPYYEFPILSNGHVYTGGSPGADRVVFTSDCSFEALITHTGASGNDFVECS